MDQNFDIQRALLETPVRHSEVSQLIEIGIQEKKNYPAQIYSVM